MINDINMEQSKIDSTEACNFDMGNGITQKHDATTEVPLTPKRGKGSALIDFTERTTFHGIRYIAEEGTVLRR